MFSLNKELDTLSDSKGSLCPVLLRNLKSALFKCFTLASINFTMDLEHWDIQMI